MEIKSRLTSQVDRINVSYQSTRIPISPQFSTVNQCPTSDSTNGDTEAMSIRNLLIIIFTIFVILLLLLLCRKPRRPRPTVRPGVSPYGHQSPYPNDSRNFTETFSTPYNRSDVGTSRRKQSPVLARRTTPGSSPRGLFSVTQ